MCLTDIAHISGLVATGEHPSPFEHCDIVTTTTHKSLRGPRAGMIFFKYTEKIPDIKERIDMAVFPALQGGPHNHQIGALAAQLLEVDTPMFKDYARQVKANAKTLAETLMGKGHKLASDGTDNHLLLWDLRPHGLTGSKVEKICEAASITLNRNAVHGDASALSPGGVRVGAPAMTTRGCTEQDFRKIGEFLDRCCQIALKIQAEKGKKLKDFEAAIPGNSEVTRPSPYFQKERFTSIRRVILVLVLVAHVFRDCQLLSHSSFNRGGEFLTIICSWPRIPNWVHSLRIASAYAKVTALKKEVEEWASRFGYPGL